MGSFTFAKETIRTQHQTPWLNDPIHIVCLSVDRSYPCMIQNHWWGICIFSEGFQISTSPSRSVGGPVVGCSLYYIFNLTSRILPGQLFEQPVISTSSNPSKCSHRLYTLTMVIMLPPSSGPLEGHPKPKVPSPRSSQIICCLLWRDKSRVKENTYIWVSV